MRANTRKAAVSSRNTMKTQDIHTAVRASGLRCVGAVKSTGMNIYLLRHAKTDENENVYIYIYIIVARVAVPLARVKVDKDGGTIDAVQSETKTADTARRCEVDENGRTVPAPHDGQRRKYIPTRSAIPSARCSGRGRGYRGRVAADEDGG